MSSDANDLVACVLRTSNANYPYSVLCCASSELRGGKERSSLCSGSMKGQRGWGDKAKKSGKTLTRRLR